MVHRSEEGAEGGWEPSRDIRRPRDETCESLDSEILKEYGWARHDTLCSLSLTFLYHLSSFDEFHRLCQMVLVSRTSPDSTVSTPSVGSHAFSCASVCLREED